MKLVINEKGMLNLIDVSPPELAIIGTALVGFEELKSSMLPREAKTLEEVFDVLDDDSIPQAYHDYTDQMLEDYEKKKVKPRADNG